MATVTHAVTATWVTTAGTASTPAATAFTPAANDLLVVVAASSGLSGGTTTVTDNNADGLGTYTQVDTNRTGFSTTGTLSVWVRNHLVGSAASTVVTAPQSGSTGGGLDVFRVSGMTLTGAAAVRGAGGQSAGTSGTTPAPVLAQAALTANPLISAVGNATSPGGVTARASWTQATTLGYSSPTTGLTTAFRSSGETTATMTWGGTSASAFASVAIELNTAVPETSPSLELYGFSIPSPPLSDATINSVTVAVSEFQSNAAQAPCSFALWDYSGTPAQIGTTQTGTPSTSSANVSSATFSGVTYAMLATLRVQVFGNANTGSGYTESVDGVSIVVNYTPSPNATVAMGSALAVTTAFPAPAVSTLVTASPSALAVTAAFPAPAAAGGANPAPSALAATAAFPAPAAAGGANPAPAVLAVTAAFPAPAVSTGGGGATVNAVTLAVTAAFPAPVVRQDQTAAPGVLSATTAFPAPVVRQDQTAAPGTLAVSTAFPAPSAAGGAKPAPATLAVTTAFPAPVVRQDAAAAPATLAVTAAFPAASVGRRTVRSMTWYPGWVQTTISPASIDWTAYNQITHLGFNPDPSGNGAVALSDMQSTSYPPAAISAAHGAGRTILVCIGEATEGSYFVTAVTNHLALFVSNIVSTCTTYGYDGVEIDWEESVTQTLYTNLLSALRTALNAVSPALLLYCDVDTGQHSTAVVSAIVPYVDQINVMSYTDNGVADMAFYTAAGIPAALMSVGIGWSTGYADLTMATTGQKVNYAELNGFAGVCAWQLGDLSSQTTDPRLIPMRDAAAGQPYGPAPATLAVTAAFPAPAVRGGANPAPAALAVTASFPAPAVSATVNATAAPATLAVTAGFPAPAVSTLVTASPATLAAAAAFPAPAVSTRVTAAPATLAVTSAFPAPAAAGGANPAPAALAVTAGFPAPAVAGGASPAPAALAVTAVFPAPAVSSSAAAVPAALAAAAAFPAPAVSSSAAVTMGSALAIAAAFPAPAVSGSGSATVSAATLAVTAAFPAPAAAGGANPAPAVLAASTAFPAPAVSTLVTASPSALAVTAAFPAPAAAGGANPAPATLAASTAFPAPAAAGGASPSPAALAVTAAFPAPAVSATQNAAVSPAALAVTAAFPAPAVSSSAAAAPATLAVTVAAGVPLVRQDATASPAVLAVAAAFPAPVAGSGTVVHGADSAQATESAFYYISGTPDSASATEGAAQVRVRGTDSAHAAEAPLSAWPSAHDAARAADKAASAWPAGFDSGHAAEGWLPFRFTLADTASAADVVHPLGIWTYLPVNVRLLGRLWTVTGLDEHGHEVVVLEAERLDGALLRLAEQVSFPAVTRRVTSADFAHNTEAVAREPVAVTCWVQSAVAVSVTVTQGRLLPWLWQAGTWCV